VKDTLERFHLDCERESIVHLFFECPCSSIFWYEMSQFLGVNINCNFVLNLSNVLLHTNEFDFSIRKIYVIDLFLLSKWSNSKPNFALFFI